MRELLSSLITDSARKDPRFVMLSGDHGYALFDEIRKHRPEQFVNVGVMEQAMVGIAAGLARTGFRPMVYGLSSFVPVRVLEQIKLDVCYSGLPVTFLGDGAGLVYSTLGSSHQCGEDIACLRAVPHIRIYSPCDEKELSACYLDAAAHDGPSYIRIGKSDRPAVHEMALSGTAPHWVHRPERGDRPGDATLVATGSMVSPALAVARAQGLALISVPRLKPFEASLVEMIQDAASGSGTPTVITIEEHSRYGGLGSAVAELLSERAPRPPRVVPVSLADEFAKKCGSYQYALSEHGLADAQLAERIGKILAAEKNTAKKNTE